MTRKEIKELVQPFFVASKQRKNKWDKEDAKYAACVVSAIENKTGVRVPWQILETNCTEINRLATVIEEEIAKGKASNFSSSSVSTSSTSSVGFSASSSSKTSNTVSTTITQQCNTKKAFDKSIEYAIGIDIGHGETSAAICPIQWDKSDALLESVTSIEMASNVKVLPSAITFTGNGDAFIGSAAFQLKNLQNAVESHVCFKQMPQDINGKAE